MSEVAVSVNNVSKIYRVYEKPHHRLIEILLRHKKAKHFTCTALNNISFTIQKGTVFGILGKNGSGKSTILQIIASILQPSSGSVSVHGRVSALLELGSGFNPDFTGIENVYLYGSILGLSKEEMEKKLPEILAFADIGEFAALPTKTYSSGMIVRLAFATAVAVEPDILIIDEALAVGDAEFQHRCALRIRKIIESGITVIFVSHDIATIKMLCDEAILLEHGNIVAQGSAEHVAQEYHRRLFHLSVQSGKPAEGSTIGMRPQKQMPLLVKNSSIEISPKLDLPSQTFLESFARKTATTRFGTGEAKIIYCEILDSHKKPTTSISFRERFIIRIFVEVRVNVDELVVGFVLRNSKGIDIFSSNTHLESRNIVYAKSGEVFAVDFEITNTLRNDHYSISSAVCSLEHFFQATSMDWIDNSVIFSTEKPNNIIVYNIFYPESLSVTTCRVNNSDKDQNLEPPHP